MYSQPSPESCCYVSGGCLVIFGMFTWSFLILYSKLKRSEFCSARLNEIYVSHCLILRSTIFQYNGPRHLMSFLQVSSLGFGITRSHSLHTDLHIHTDTHNIQHNSTHRPGDHQKLQEVSKVQATKKDGNLHPINPMWDVTREINQTTRTTYEYLYCILEHE